MMSVDSDIPDFVREAVLSLPPLPQAAQRILRLARDPNFDFRQLVDVISTDQTLTARVLRAANSALYGTPREIQTLRQAMVLLGRDAIIQLVLSVSVLNMKTAYKGSKTIDRNAFWRHSMAVGVAARRLATDYVDGVDPEQAFIAGLMHDIGKLVMIEHFGERYVSLFDTAQQGARPLHHIEQEVLDVDHAVVGQALCEHWRLSTPLAQAVTGHHDVDADALGLLPPLVRTSNALVKTVGLGQSGNRFVMRIGRPLASARHQELVCELPHEVREMEAAFTSSSGDSGDLTAQPGERSVVYLNVSAPEVEDMIAIALWAMEFQPIALADVNSTSVPDVEASREAGIVTDQPETVQQNGQTQSEMIVLDYRAWERNEGAGGAEELDAESLRTWLQQRLPHPAYDGS